MLVGYMYDNDDYKNPLVSPWLAERRHLSICLDPLCLEGYKDLKPVSEIHAGDGAVDEGRFLTCSSCTEVLDKEQYARYYQGP